MLKIKHDNVFFISDEHFYHNNIIKFCNRPFASIEEMHAVLIDKFNQKVNKDSVTFHLGDFILNNNIENIANIINSLNGKHIFLKGSHDSWLKRLNKIYQLIPNKFYHTNIEKLTQVKIMDQLIVLCHWPLLTWEQDNYGCWHLYGHVHGEKTHPSKYKCLEVGVDANNFEPLSFAEIREM